MQNSPKSRKPSKSWQIHTLPEAKHGDLALSRGLTATQIGETRVPCNTDDATSNAHELVVVQLQLDERLPQKRPSLEFSSDAPESSAAQPAAAARRLSEDSRAHKFLAALDEAANMDVMEDGARDGHQHPSNGEEPRRALRGPFGGRRRG